MNLNLNDNTQQNNQIQINQNCIINSKTDYEEYHILNEKIYVDTINEQIKNTIQDLGHIIKNTFIKNVDR